VQIEATSLPGVRLVAPRVLTDARGFFFESWNAAQFDQAVGTNVSFVQDNHSSSARSVLRGLHYQLDPKPQGKLVRVIKGEIFDVAVDIRRSSQSFGQWAAFVITAENKRQLWVPPGFAHGFLALTDDTQVLYKVTEYFEPKYDRSIRWNDPDIGIEWPLEIEPILSAKDENAPYLRDADVFA
jgi:dTDP-4-dehydrorhamnose 3,5-epimerase